MSASPGAFFMTYAGHYVSMSFSFLLSVLLYAHLICCDHNTYSPFYNLILYHKHFDIYYNLLGRI